MQQNGSEWKISAVTALDRAGQGSRTRTQVISMIHAENKRGKYAEYNLYFTTNHK